MFIIYITIWWSSSMAIYRFYTTVKAFFAPLCEHLKQKDAQSKFSEGGGVVQRNWKSHSKFCSDDTIYLFCLRTFNLSLHLKFYPSECDTVKELSSHSNQTWLRPKTPPNQSENIFWQNVEKKLHLSTNIDKTQGKRIYLEIQVHENVINFKHLFKTKCVCLSDLYFLLILKVSNVKFFSNFSCDVTLLLWILAHQAAA